ncbi:DUF4116 domain-containing protein [Variovorax sp. W2I14]|uniref:DUF4116 domain-containing protein n=1 Tax=Variovorax sp. W2I14 TaxID=3042290 RepID=UPI003D225E9A
MADTKDKRSLWKRVSEGIQTLVPKDPGSYSARKLSIEAQRENAINWLSKQPFIERSREEFGTDLPSHLLNDAEFASRLNMSFGDEVANRVVPLEVRRSTEYQAGVAHGYGFLNAALRHDQERLQLPLTDLDDEQEFSERDKRHAIEVIRRMGPEEALEFINKDLPKQFIAEEKLDEIFKERAQTRAVEALSDDVLTNKDFLLALDMSGFNLGNLPQHIRDNDAVMKDCLEESPYFFQVASKAVRSDQESFEKSLKGYWDIEIGHPRRKDAEQLFAENYSFAEKNIKENPRNFLVAQQESFYGLSVKDTPQSIRDNKEVIEALLKWDNNALRFASRELRKDKKFILDMTEKYQVDVSRETLIKDRQVALNLTKTNSITLDKLPEHLQANSEFVENVIRLNGNQLQYTSKANQDDYALARLAVSQPKSNALKHCSERLKNDPSLVYAACEFDGYSIEYASEELRNNRYLAIHAVQQEPKAIQCLPDELRQDIEILTIAAEGDPRALIETTDEMFEILTGRFSKEAKEEWDRILNEDAHPARFDEVMGDLLLESFNGYKVELERNQKEEALAQAQEQHLEKVLTQSDLTNKEDIAVWLKHYGVEDFTINDDLTVDVSGDVNLRSKRSLDNVLEVDGIESRPVEYQIPLTHLPFQFGKVSGNFDISANGVNGEYATVHQTLPALRSLEGSPHEIGGDFICARNNLSSLEGGPAKVGGVYDCSSNELSSVKGAPSYVGKDFKTEGNPHLEPEHVKSLSEKISLSRATPEATKREPVRINLAALGDEQAYNAAKKQKVQTKEATKTFKI